MNFVVREKKYNISAKKNRIVVIIPAHNEELLIERLLSTLKKQSYPLEHFSICVVADNCDDNTEQVANSAGVEVLVRKDTKNKGKGYAINHAIKYLEKRDYDAILIVDADSTVNKECLAQLNILLNENKKIIQLYNAVGNPYKSALTSLMNVSRTIANEIIGPAKSKLGLSFHLMGNGMCFTRDIIEKYGWHSFSVGEDWEFFAALVLDAQNIHFSKHARVYHQESQSLKQATPQRLRWSSGRFHVLWHSLGKLLGNKRNSISLKTLDSFTALIFPNPSLSINIMVLCFIFTLLFTNDLFQKFLIIWLIALLLINVAIFIVGCFYTTRPLKSLASFIFAPLFLIWKMAIDCVSILGIGRKEWKRTSRIQE